jgi:hypothetical protein
MTPPAGKYLMKSAMTGKFCRLATVNAGTQGIVCDVAAADAALLATEFTYTGTMLAVGSTPISKPCAACPLYLGGNGTAAMVDPGGWGGQAGSCTSLRGPRLLTGVFPLTGHRGLHSTPAGLAFRWHCIGVVGVG